ncbi:uncharacterized protein J3R85_003444 [Psidium guajava]|nr:uncharacterized protein J3R85_003444 [Psidium guajava]
MQRTMLLFGEDVKFSPAGHDPFVLKSCRWSIPMWCVRRDGMGWDGMGRG